MRSRPSVSTIRNAPARLTAAVFLSLAVTGCVDRIETRIGAQGSLPPGAQVMIAQGREERGEAGGEDAPSALTGDLARELTAAGLAVAPDAALTIDMGVGVRPAAVGVWPGQDNDPGALSPSRHIHGKGCAPQIFRVTLSAVDRASARTVAHASAEESHCGSAPAEIMPALVRQAVVALVSARPGVRIVKRPGKD